MSANNLMSQNRHDRLYESNVLFLLCSVHRPHDVMRRWNLRLHLNFQVVGRDPTLQEASTFTLVSLALAGPIGQYAVCRGELFLPIASDFRRADFSLAAVHRCFEPVIPVSCG